MAIRFDHNNNSEEWQMLFDKINNGSPFGVITFNKLIEPSSYFDEIMNSYISSEPTNQDRIRSFLINKREFIGFVEIVIGPSESLFFVYENEPSATFNLKNYLLVLATTYYCKPKAICYCENKQDTQNTDTKEIKFLETRTHFFGKEFGSTKVKIEISNSETFWDFLLELRNEFYSFVLDGNPIEYYKDLIKIKKTINDRISMSLYPHNNCFVYNKYSGNDFLINSTFEKHMESIKSHYKRFRETFLLDYSETLPSETINKLKARVIEERDQQKSEKNKIYKQSSVQNIKINEIAKDLESGKIVGEKIINNALFYASKEYTGSSYCFIDPKDLETQLLQKLSQNKADLSNRIIEALNQLSFQPSQSPIITYVLIRRVRYNFNYNTFHFIFDIVNFLDEKLEFIIEVPREALDLENVDRLVENYSHGSLSTYVREGFFILDTHLKE
ncbi:hypothetical protein [Helicobacter pylori]|uniref:Uncharacterized protein n=1 Tax=Helicobacter pylori TaxID=210 RepID=A0A2A6S4N7_HELPX|nr:hypothetical protein [Helicobacter pylori]MBM0598928.1 hypothetical protein [Helicobacter pylori]OOP82192.1 hypothetical protein B0X30_02515 [Helicobacter pylori]OOQ28506.1 hypothetical protein B0X67_02280 [Helicobacter pylori]OOQ39002.1 hypothetical protein B0X64_08050 [Helicobacter pylori]PDW14867.1 hypothetical protein BB409_05825 [Helicobacter pylori]